MRTNDAESLRAFLEGAVREIVTEDRRQIAMALVEGAEAVTRIKDRAAFEKNFPGLTVEEVLSHAEAIKPFAMLLAVRIGSKPLPCIAVMHAQMLANQSKAAN